MVEKAAAAPAIEIASSSSGVSPLVPTAPTTSSPTFSGMPPVRHEAPCSASAPRRPPETCSSISREGRTKIDAVRALSTATRALATWAPCVRRIATTSPEGSTTQMYTRARVAAAASSAAAITASAPAVSMTRRVRTSCMAVQASLGGLGVVAAHTAVSAVMKMRPAPPKARFTAPGTAIAPTPWPLGSKTCTPAGPAE